MSMIKLRVLFPAIGLWLAGYTCVAQSDGSKRFGKNKIKSITGSIYDADIKDSVVCWYKEFDSLGNVVEEKEPLQYCGIKMQYNGPRGQLSSREVFCGESSGNGEYTYVYPNDTIVIETFSGAVGNS